MARITEHCAKLPASYLFPEIGRRVRAHQAQHPDARVIRLGIGDVTEPLTPAISAGGGYVVLHPPLTGQPWYARSISSPNSRSAGMSLSIFNSA
jgi:hypothetical protein